jgi:hypothetical protein
VRILELLDENLAGTFKERRQIANTKQATLLKALSGLEECVENKVIEQSKVLHRYISTKMSFVETKLDQVS